MAIDLERAKRYAEEQSKKKSTGMVSRAIAASSQPQKNLEMIEQPTEQPPQEPGFLENTGNFLMNMGKGAIQQAGRTVTSGLQLLQPSEEQAAMMLRAKGLPEDVISQKIKEGRENPSMLQQFTKSMEETYGLRQPANKYEAEFLEQKGPLPWLSSGIGSFAFEYGMGQKFWNKPLDALTKNTASTLKAASDVGSSSIMNGVAKAISSNYGQVLVDSVGNATVSAVTAPNGYGKSSFWTTLAMSGLLGTAGKFYSTKSTQAAKTHLGIDEATYNEIFDVADDSKEAAKTRIDTMKRYMALDQSATKRNLTTGSVSNVGEQFNEAGKQMADDLRATGNRIGEIEKTLVGKPVFSPSVVDEVTARVNGLMEDRLNVRLNKQWFDMPQEGTIDLRTNKPVAMDIAQPMAGVSREVIPVEGRNPFSSVDYTSTVSGIAKEVRNLKGKGPLYWLDTTRKIGNDINWDKLSAGEAGNLQSFLADVRGILRETLYSELAKNGHTALADASLQYTNLSRAVDTFKKITKDGDRTTAVIRAAFGGGGREVQIDDLKNLIDVIYKNTGKDLRYDTIAAIWSTKNFAPEAIKKALDISLSSALFSSGLPSKLGFLAKMADSFRSPNGRYLQNMKDATKLLEKRPIAGVVGSKAGSDLFNRVFPRAATNWLMDKYRSYQNEE